VEEQIKAKLALLGKGEVSAEAIAKLVPKGELGLQLCKDRIKAVLRGVTSYSKAGYCWTLRRVALTSRDELTTHENELVYLQETLHELAQNPPTALNWLDFSEGFQAMLQACCKLCMYVLFCGVFLLIAHAVLQLRSEMVVERGQAVLDCICMDEDVLKGIGAAQQLRSIVGTPPDELIRLLKQGPAQHLLQHAYEYRRKFDIELASIKRIKELQVPLPASLPKFVIPISGAPGISGWRWVGGGVMQMRGVALVGTALVAVLVGAANFLSRVIYDGVYDTE
jgi:hypothetical protein